MTPGETGLPEDLSHGGILTVEARTPSSTAWGDRIRQNYRKNPIISPSTATALPSTAPRPRSRGVSISPIRSMNTKATPHNNSSATLRPDPSVSQDESHPTQGLQQTTSSVSKSIHDLEGLVHEALEMAKVAAEKEEQHNVTKIDIDINTRRERVRQPSACTKSMADSSHENLPHTNVQTELPAPSTKPRSHLHFLEHRSHGHKNQGTMYRGSGDTIQACGPVHEPIISVKSALAAPKVTITDWELQKGSPHRGSISDNIKLSEPTRAAFALKEPQEHLSRRKNSSGSLPSRNGVRSHVKACKAPPIQPRSTSMHRSLRSRHVIDVEDYPLADLTGPRNEYEDKDLLGIHNHNATPYPAEDGHEGHFSQIFGIASKQGSIDFAHPTRSHTQKIDLRGCRHVDIHEKEEDLDLHESCNHRPVARNWPDSRKRFAAVIACITTACLGIIIGIYAGEVPAIQYVIVDFHHYTILGNVFLYLGLAIPTLFLWPLPLLHGRKPYTIIGLALALCLQIPQGIAVGAFRSPYVGTYRKLLLLSRAMSGLAFGFVYINQQATLLDLFGASLQSRHPHQEVVNEYDVRRHGGGMGFWLGLWTWCTVGSISVGFLIGAMIISSADVTWGFWTSLLLLMCVLLLNVIGPELRRSAFRRTVSEIWGENIHFSRVARGEVKMHLKGAGPYWWGEEVKAGIEMCWLMLKQPGFLVLAVYAAWVYAQFSMILMLLGALASRYYKLRPTYVGLCAMSLAVGALLAIPFQKASLFSRARRRRQRTDSMTFKRSLVWSSHLARRVVFTVLLPLAALAYTLTSSGPRMPVAIPCVFAAVVGFLSNLALAECYGLIMEAFDTSDLQPGMTGRPARRSIATKVRALRTNFSCYPRVSAGFAITQSLSFVLGAAATGVCGRVERRLGTVKATAVVAGILMVLTILLTLVLWRFASVRMIPPFEREPDSLTRRKTDWEPVILGHPSGTTRKINILEAGRQTRWSEIRRKNRVNTTLN